MAELPGFAQVLRLEYEDGPAADVERKNRGKHQPSQTEIRMIMKIPVARTTVNAQVIQTRIASCNSVKSSVMLVTLKNR